MQAIEWCHFRSPWVTYDPDFNSVARVCQLQLGFLVILSFFFIAFTVLTTCGRLKLVISSFTVHCGLSNRRRRDGYCYLNLVKHWSILTYQSYCAIQHIQAAHVFFFNHKCHVCSSLSDGSNRPRPNENQITQSPWTLCYKCDTKSRESSILLRL